MTHANLAVVVLAAGLGTRMKSARPKVLHGIAGRPMLGYVLDAVAALAPERVVIVAGPGMEPAVDDAAAGAGVRHETVVQDRRLGTGHAVACARPALDGYHGPEGAGDVLVVFGDTPLLQPRTLRALVEARRGPRAPDLLGVAFRPAEPAQYGRVVVGEGGQVLRIAEYADAGEEERRIDLCNAGILLGHGPVLLALVDRLGKDNAKGEYYLTDVYALANADGRRVRAAEADPEEVLGVNSRAELAVAEAVVQTRLRARAMAEGATLVDPAAVWLSWDTRLGRDVTVQPNVFFGPGVVVGDDAEIRSFCHLEGARIEPGAVVGPFARLRPGTVVGAGARVGNFVEVKNAVLGPGAKANHLSYLGDAEVGARANIGAGTITCNYDGIAKHRTTIGKGAFIGSNTALVAPVSVGAGAIVGAGSTITRDVDADAVAVARGDQRQHANAAQRFRERRRAQTARGGKADGTKQRDA
ncbi:MAG: bifunctional UDP-N-acetylglucosamine diphosphorylase/glucosamine-1-phosphate N-acetyltransferase GlmU [Kiloniellaceae bacterium]